MKIFRKDKYPEKHKPLAVKTKGVSMEPRISKVTPRAPAVKFTTEIRTIEAMTREEFDAELSRLYNTYNNVKVLASNLKAGPVHLYIMTVKLIYEIKTMPQKPQSPKGRVSKECQRPVKGCAGPFPRKRESERP